MRKREVISWEKKIKQENTENVQLSEIIIQTFEDFAKDCQQVEFSAMLSSCLGNRCTVLDQIDIMKAIILREPTHKLVLSIEIVTAGNPRIQSTVAMQDEKVMFKLFI